jgi:hypothetical protein
MDISKVRSHGMNRGSRLRIPRQPVNLPSLADEMLRKIVAGDAGSTDYQCFSLTHESDLSL